VIIPSAGAVRPLRNRLADRVALHGVRVRMLVCVVLLGAVTGAIELLKAHVPVLSLAVLYLLAILPVAVAWGLVFAAAVAIASTLAFNFFFLPPLYTLTLQDSRNWFALLVFLVTAVVVSELGARSRRQARESVLLAQVAGALLERGEVSRELEQVGAEVARALGVERARISLGPGPSPNGYPLVAGARQVGTLRLERPHGLGTAAARSRVLPALASLLGMAIDRERLAREALEAETLRRSDTMKTAILRAVSHDLRTPLMAILTSASTLVRPDLALDDADRAELLDTVLAEARRLDRLVANLLDLSRLQAGAAEPRAEVVSVDDLVVGALDGLGDEGARVQVSLPEDLPAVRVDAQQVQRALANLLENALKYSPVIEPVLVRVTSTSTEVLLRVIDRGSGVPGRESELIFAPFQRGSGGVLARGAGLGLSIAQGFAEANGGRLWVESHSGQGATFVLAVPVAPLAVHA
jgi:two-component system, OmpR family, sensor histidine kinase KdpD